MKFLAMHITNQKLSFDIFTVGNIFMEHDLNYDSCAAYDCVCAPGTHICNNGVESCVTLKQYSHIRV